MTTTPSSTAGRYRIISEIGRGGLGVVYKAVDLLSQQTIALKRLHGEWHTADHNDRILLANEFRTGAALSHPYIVSLLDYGFDQSQQPFFTMSLVDGSRTITEYLLTHADDKQLPVRLLMQILEALEYLHRCGVIHRDLKPANVLVCDEDNGEPPVVRLVDFGVSLSRITAISDPKLTGTLAYMSPELLRGGTATVASDLWAVGIMMYQVFTGEHPFAADTAQQLLARITREQPDLYKLPTALIPVIGRLLVMDPSDRYTSAREVVDMLGDALNHPRITELSAIRDSYLHSAPFLGREPELATLTAMFTDPSAPRAHLVGGVSGIGKSRLIEEVRVRALINGVVVVRGLGVEAGSEPYDFWIDPLRRLLLNIEVTDEVASVLKQIISDIDLLVGRAIAMPSPLWGADGEARLVHAILTVVAQQPRPVLLLFEDWHWAEESRAPLLALLNALPELPHVRIIATYREDIAPNLVETLPGMTPLLLRPLDLDTVATLVKVMTGEPRGVGALIELLYLESKGNPFYLVEALRVLADQAGGLTNIASNTLPLDIFTGGIRQIVHRRLTQVPKMHREFLKLAAVAGRRLNLAILNQIHDQLDDFITSCANIAIFSGVDGVWHFAHDSLRTGVLLDLTDDERVRLHLQVAHAIETVYPSDPRYAIVLAGHYRAAGDQQGEVATLLTAIQTLKAIALVPTTQQLIERGLALAALLEDESLIARLQIEQGDFSYLRGALADARVAYDHARQIAERYQDAETLALALERLGM